LTYKNSSVLLKWSRCKMDWSSHGVCARSG